MRSFEITADTCGTTVRLTAAGDLDAAVAPILETAILRAVGLAPERVVLDLEGTSAVSPAGLRAIAGGQQNASAHAVDFIVLPRSLGISVDTSFGVL